MKECKVCGSKSVRSTELTEIINVFNDSNEFTDIKVKVDVDRCNLCGSYEYTKERAL